MRDLCNGLANHPITTIHLCNGIESCDGDLMNGVMLRDYLHLHFIVMCAVYERYALFSEYHLQAM